MDQVQTMMPLLDAATSMEDAYVAFTLLRSFFGACRLSYTLCVVPYTMAMRGAVAFDPMIEDSMRRLLGGSLSREYFRELQPPVKSNTPTFGVWLQSASR